MTSRRREMQIPHDAPIAVGIGIVLMVLFAALAVVAVPLIYALGTIYGFTKGMTLNAETLNPTILFLIVAGVVTAFVVGVLLLVGRIGKSMEPPTRRERRKADRDRAAEADA